MKAVINKENIEVMKTLHDAGVELAKIAKIVNVSYTVVTRAKRAGFNFETYKQDIHDRNQKYSKLHALDKKVETPTDVCQPLPYTITTTDSKEVTILQNIHEQLVDLNEKSIVTSLL